MQVEKNGNEVKKNQATVERKSDREVVVTRVFNGPAVLIFDAWTKPELVKRWWAPRSYGLTLVTCEIDLRAGGKYRYVFDVPGKEPREFFGKYLQVERPTHLAWTNADEGDAVTTATFTEKNGKTTLTLHELHPSKEALDAHMSSGVVEGTGEQFDQLDELLGSDGKIS